MGRRVGPGWEPSSVNTPSRMKADLAGVQESRPSQAIVEPAPPVWEQCAAMIVIVMMTGALIGPIFAPTQEETPVLRLAWLPIYAIISGLLVIRVSKLVRVWPAVLMLGPMFLYAWASQFWSIDAETTSRRVLALAFASAFSIYLGAVFTGPHLPRLLMCGGVLMGLGSLVMVIAFPTIGLHLDVNAPLWRGLWYEKNQMGFVMVVGAIGAAACLATDDRRRLLPAIALVMTSALVIATQSKTALLCLGVGVGSIFCLWLLRKGGPVFTVIAIWLGVAIGGVGAWYLISDPTAALEALGKDPSLTGRTDIWDSLMRRVEERPWAGYGYNAFWGKESVPAAFVRAETGWRVPSAHNGWIDLLVQLGWIGVIGVGVLMLTTVLISVFRLGGAGRREGYWSIGYLLAFLVLSLSESVLLSHANLPWALFLAIVARAVSTERSQIRPPDYYRRGTGRHVMARQTHRTSFAPAFSLPAARYPRRDWT